MVSILAKRFGFVVAGAMIVCSSLQAVKIKNNTTDTILIIEQKTLLYAGKETTVDVGASLAVAAYKTDKYVSEGPRTVKHKDAEITSTDQNGKVDIGVHGFHSTDQGAFTTTIVNLSTYPVDIYTHKDDAFGQCVNTKTYVATLITDGEYAWKHGTSDCLTVRMYYEYINAALFSNLDTTRDKEVSVDWNTKQITVKEIDAK